jgi:beta-glucosidase/6-phospho-beta-glucosidase/beta-galactosidase
VGSLGATLAAAFLLAFTAPAQATKPLPKGFLWGVATAGFQNEMGPGSPSDPNSDWWVWSHDPDNIKSGHVSGDQPEHGPSHWKNYKRDIRLARTTLNANAYRLSIEWSRIFPRSTAGAQTIAELDALADHSALAHYRAELQAIREAGMTAFVTLVHFTLPAWIHDPIAARNALQGRGPDDPPPTGFGPAGWLDPQTPVEFAKYAGYVAAKLGDLVGVWTPMNEPNVVAIQGYLNVQGVFASWFPPGVFSFRGVLEALAGEERGNAAAYDAIKQQDPVSRVGLVQHMIAFRPAKPGNTADQRGAQHADQLFNRAFLDAAILGDYDANADGTIDASERHPELAHKADFVGVNYYRAGTVTGLPQPISQTIPAYDFIPKVDYSKKDCPSMCSDVGWEIRPAALGQMLREAAGYHLPLYVTENGIADSRDRLRARYIRDHVAAMRRAIDSGVDVRGYFEWTLTDNYEWSNGFGPKFGLFTKAGKPRKSAQVFAGLTKRR